MLELLAKIIPLAAASTLSPIILGISLVLLAGRNSPKKRAFAFLMGGVVVAALLAFLGSQVGGGGMVPGHLSAHADLFLGAMFIAFAVSSFRSREKENVPNVGAEKEKGFPGMLKLFIAGFVVNITNLDAVVLNFTAIKEIFGSSIMYWEKIALTLFCDLFFLLPGMLPLLVYLIMPEKAENALEPIGKAMRKYGRYVVGAIFLLFGTYFIWKGASLLGWA